MQKEKIKSILEVVKNIDEKTIEAEIEKLEKEMERKRKIYENLVWELDDLRQKINFLEEVKRVKR